MSTTLEPEVLDAAKNVTNAVPTSSPSDWPNIDDIVIEDDAPVDHQYSEKQMRLLTEPLYANWKGPTNDGRYLAAANVGLFFTTKEPPLVPDVLLSTDMMEPPGDITEKANQSYFVWLRGKVPDLVLEIVSNKVGGEDTVKPPIYARWRVTYYVIYDPQQYLSDEVLRVFVLKEGKYVRKPDNGWFELCGLGLTLWHGVYEHCESIWLRWADKTGEPIPTGAEATLMAKEEAQAAKDEAKAVRQALDDAEKRATAEKERTARLLALLQAQGIDTAGL